MKKPPPPPPKPPAKKLAKPAAKKAVAQPVKKSPAKKAPVAPPEKKAKVMPIDAGRKSKKSSVAKPPAFKRKPKLLVYHDYGNGIVGPKLYTRGNVFDETRPDPERVLEELHKRESDEPSVRMRKAVARLIRMGTPVREALANYGISEGQFHRWRDQAQRDYEDGARSTPCLDFVRVLEIAEAQGEVAATLDARMQAENVMPFLRVRYARNWDGKMAGAAPLTFIKEPEAETPVEDAEAAYMLALLENARGGKKPKESDEPQEN